MAGLLAPVVASAVLAACADDPSPGPSGWSQTSSVVVRNASTQNGAACLTWSGLSVDGPSSALVWQSRQLSPGDENEIDWQTDYGFVLGQSSLQPGSIFFPSQTVPAELSSASEISVVEQFGLPSFTDQRPGSSSNSFIVHQRSSAPATVGIAISNSAVVAAVVSNGRTVSFSPFGQLWIAFGDCFQGQVVDPANLPHAAPVPGGSYVRATLNRDLSSSFDGG